MIAPLNTERTRNIARTALKSADHSAGLVCIVDVLLRDIHLVVWVGGIALIVIFIGVVIGADK